MIRTLTRSLAAAALIAASGAVLAQGGPGAAASPDGKPRAKARYDCSQAADPKACEARRAKFREAAAKARAACQGTQGAERQACMSKAMCAESADPAKCEARAKARAERRAARAKARAEGKHGPSGKSPSGK
ncbi:MAG TPA: hypothetical protein VK043_07555 [Burkholderiales bacterium]|nr:hypothetical protein [Burkholderiales bacterium]